MDPNPKAAPHFSPGQKVGVYVVDSLLGAGGMGEVYRARDTKLKRDVALKRLRGRLTSDSQSMARFKREAQMLAAFNHPNIGTIYGFEELDGTALLVLELIDGQTLFDRIQQGPLPLKESIAIASQIVDALEAAHDRGIIHRDLKPRNVGLTSADLVKVFDFGLAKEVSSQSTHADSTHPTGFSTTGEGAILGTAAYMSPEQARGLPVDKRTDIWAFGCLLYEMLTGKRPFPGATANDILVAVIEKEPDWTSLPAETPRSIVRLLERCLAKDARRRLRDIGDARLEFDDAFGPEGSSTTDSRASVDRRWRGLAIIAAIMLPAGIAAGLWLAQAGPVAFEQLTVRRRRIGGAGFVSRGV